MQVDNEELIKITISEPSWEDVIIKIVVEKNINPWNIDIVKLADAFVEYLRKMEAYDLRIPARFILIAAILVRMKSDIFAEKRDRILIPEGPGAEKDSELLRVLASIPPLQPPLERSTVANITLPELILALKKAFEVEQRRKVKKERMRARLAEILPTEKDDINERISNLFQAILETIEHVEKMTTFRNLIKKWERKEIVKSLLPMLYLSQDGKIDYDQPVLFDEIYIKLREGLKSNESENPENNKEHAAEQ